MHSFKQLITGHNFRIGSYLYSHTIQNILYVNKESEIVTRRSLCARCIVRPNKPNVGIWGIQMKFYFRATQGELVAWAQKTHVPWWLFRKRFYKQNVGWGLLDVWLSSVWWWGNRMVLQESWAQPEVTFLHLDGASVLAEELKDIAMYILWGGTKILL